MRYENLHMIRSRIRMFESVGMSLGIFVAAAAVGLAFVGSEVMWQSVNRGKSFEEVVEEMQGRPDRKAVAGRRMRRGGEVAEDVDDVSS